MRYKTFKPPTILGDNIPPTYPLVGIIGKTNVGKSTFFSAATLVQVKIENRPFVTIEPNVGIGYVRTRCAHISFSLSKCMPQNSICLRGIRYVPIKLMDVAGLVKDAHKGRGLGNQFLDDLRQSDVLLHVIDASGSTDEGGNYVGVGKHDPIQDIFVIESEIDEWFHSIVSKDWVRFKRSLETVPYDKALDLLHQKVSGLSIRREHIVKALKLAKLDGSKFGAWRDEELRTFSKCLRVVAKPIVVVANKMDIPESEDNLKRIIKELPDRTVVPVSAEYELALRKAAKADLISYLPGDDKISVIKPEALTPRQRDVLRNIGNFIEKFGGTGVQEALNTAVFKVLNMIAVYPVEDVNKLTDSKGNILPDTYLVPKGSTALDLAHMIHTDLGRGFLYAVLAKDKKRVGSDYVLSDGDVVKVVSTLAHG
ncbi:MAG: redox-regulated ATPase YchF [Sulfolobales archaeon]